MIAVGGFPLSLAAKNVRSRTRWFENYIDYSINQDIPDISRIQHLNLVEPLMQCLALSNAQIVNESKVSVDLGMKETTLRSYKKVLEKIFMTYELPVSRAIKTNRLSKHSKLHFVDSGIATNLLGLDEESILGVEPDTLTNVGHLYENFAINEILRQIQGIYEVRRVGYWRTRDDDEIDCILELRNKKVIAIEIKSNELLRNSDFTPMRKYQRLAGEKFAFGLILHSGVKGNLYDKNIASLPLDCLWA
jgi:predicted AAA+ superfamily ATPase